MQVGLDSKVGQAFPEMFCRGLSRILCNDYTSHIQTDGLEGIDQAQDVQIVSDAQVAPQLILFNGIRADDNDDFRLVF